MQRRHPHDGLHGCMTYKHPALPCYVVFSLILPSLTCTACSNWYCTY